MKKTTKDRVYLTPVEAAELLMVSTASIRLWATKGLLAAQMTAGGHRRFLMRDIENFAKSMAIETRKSSDIKVLVIDDNKQLLCYLTELLSDLPGIESIEVASDGFNGGRKVESFRPDVLLLDIKMPGLDGIEVCERLMASESNQQIRVIAMTGYASKHEIDRMMAAGAEACLSKPINTQALFKVLGIEK